MSETTVTIMCNVCGLIPADAMVDTIGLVHLEPLVKIGYHPVCPLCDLLNDLFWDIRVLPYNVGMDYQ